jgi:hypothetical protein
VSASAQQVHGTRSSISSRSAKTTRGREAREGLRRRQEAIGGGAFPFRANRQIKEEEVRYCNKFAEETKMEEETWAREEDDEEDDEDR